MTLDTLNVIKLLVAVAIGFLLGFTYGTVNGMGYLREQCEKYNMFHYRHNNTTYYCATEQQLKDIQNDLRNNSKAGSV